MKKLFLIGLATLSVAALHAADPQPADSKSDNQAPPPPQGDKSEWHHRGDKKMMDRGPGKRGPGGMKRERGGMRGDRGGWKDQAQRRGGPDRFHAKGGPGGPRAEGHPMANALKLTDDQKAKAKELFEATRPKIEAIRKEEREKIKAVMDDARKELRPLLTPEQQAVFDDVEKVRAAQSDLTAAREKLAATQKDEAPAKEPKKD